MYTRKKEKIDKANAMVTYYLECLDLEKTAKHFNVTSERIRQILPNSLKPGAEKNRIKYLTDQIDNLNIKINKEKRELKNDQIRDLFKLGYSKYKIEVLLNCKINRKHFNEFEPHFNRSLGKKVKLQVGSEILICDTIEEASKILQLDQSTVVNVLRGKYKAMGYKIEYIKD